MTQASLFTNLPEADEIDGTEQVYVEQGAPPAPRRTTVSKLGFGRQPLSATLSAIANTIASADRMLVFTGANSADMIYISPFVQSLLSAADSREFQQRIDIDPSIIAQINAGVAAAAWAVETAANWARESQQAQAQVAALAAQVAANAAAFNLTGLNAQLATLNARMGIAEVSIATLQSLGFGATKVYADQAAMIADVGAQPDGTKAVTIADGSEWYKSPVSHTWITFPGDRMTKLEARVDELDNPTRALDFSAGSTYTPCRTPQIGGNDAIWAGQVVSTYGVAGAGTYRLGRTGAGPAPDNNLLGLLCKQLTNLKNKTVTIEATFTAEGSSAGISGIAMLFAPTIASVLGGTDFPAADSCLGCVWRSTGQLVWYDGLLTLVGGGGSAVPEIGVISANSPYSVGDRCRMVCRFNEDATGAIVTLILNDVPQGSFTFTGIPPSWFFGPGIRVAAGGTIWDLTKFQVDNRAQGVTKVYYLDGTAAGGGTGTKAHRFNDIKQAQLAALQQAESAIFMMAAGTYKGTFRFQSDQFRKLEWQAEGSNKVTIDASTDVPAAPGTWVRHDAATYPNVWNRAFLFDGKPIVGGNGSVCELDVPSIRRGVQVLPYHHMWRIDPTLSQAAAWSSCNANQGSYFIDVTSKKVYIHASASADPNSHHYALLNQSYCIGVEALDRAGHYGTEVAVFGLELLHASAGGLTLNRCRINVHNVISQGNGLNGFSCNESDGTVTNSFFYGNVNDGLNSSMVNTWPPYPPRTTKVMLYRNKSWYNGWFRFWPFTDPKEYGDGLSAHPGTDYVDFGGDYRYNGKCGTGNATGGCYGFDVISVGNHDGNFQYGSADANQPCEAIHYRPISMDSDTYGYLLTNAPSLAGNSSIMTLYDPVVINCPTAFAAIGPTPGAGSTCQLHLHNPKGSLWVTLLSQSGSGQVVWHDPDPLIPRPGP